MNLDNFKETWQQQNRMRKMHLRQFVVASMLLHMATVVASRSNEDS